MTFDPVAWALDREPSAPARARTLVGSLCSQRSPDLGPDARETVLLLVTELVTNAVRHGREPVSLTVGADEAVLRVAVSDHAPGVPVLSTSTDPWSEGGRGLLLVEALSSSWGVTPLPDGGKSVWFEVAVVSDGVELSPRE